MKRIVIALALGLTGCAQMMDSMDTRPRASTTPKYAPVQVETTTQHRADYIVARDAAVKGATETVDFLKLVSKPGNYASKVVKTRARWRTAEGDVAYIDSFGGSGSVIVELTPTLRIGPVAYFALEFADWQERQVFFDGLKRTQVDLVVAVSSVPATPQQPCSARILDVQAASN